MLTYRQIFDMTVALTNTPITGYLETEESRPIMEVSELNAETTLFQTRFLRVLLFAMRVIYPLYEKYCKAKDISVFELHNEPPYIEDNCEFDDRFTVVLITLCCYLLFWNPDHYKLYEEEMTKIRHEIPAHIQNSVYGY